jgi:hypothetical protein
MGGRSGKALMPFRGRLIKMGACPEAVEWVGSRGLSAAWRECERADWMLWFAARVEIDRKALVLAACDCAETALRFVPEGEDRPRVAIETARRWARGAATLQETRDAADAASAADSAADASAEIAASYAAHASYAAAASASSASYAAVSAADSAADAYAAYGGVRAHKRMSALVRKRITVKMLSARCEELDR